MPRAAGREPERAEFTPPSLCATCAIRSEKISSRKALTISGVDRFTRRGGTCRLHAIFMNQLCIIWGYQEELSSTASWRDELVTSLCGPQELSNRTLRRRG